MITGVSANDLCEVTNQGQRFLRAEDTPSQPAEAQLSPLGKKDILERFERKERLRVGLRKRSALWQSHYGALTSLHVMAKTPDEPAVTTLREVQAWFDFLNDVALGNTAIAPNARIGSDGTPIDRLFVTARLRIEYHQLFDSHNDAEIRSRAAGMMLHLIEDSYTPCHCRRESDGRIAEFYSYELQASDKHRKADDVLERDQPAMVAECRRCAESVLVRRVPYDHTGLLQLTAHPNPAGAGPYR